jgi:dTDP-4-dehydrorhamnose reductase
VYAGSNSNASEEDIPIPDKTWYAYSKLLADEHIIRHSDNYLIVRGSHRINPFPYATAWNDQIGNFDDVDILVNQWLKLIKAEQKGLWNIGTP